MNLKTQVRQAFRSLLQRDTDPCTRAYADEALGRRLTQLLRGQSGLWGAFQPTGFEPDLRPAFDMLSTSIQFVFPRVEGDELGFYLPKERSSLVLNQWGILEPDPVTSHRIELTQMRGLLIPGLAFDAQCNRMGRGRGFYDRTLNELKKIKEAKGVRSPFGDDSIITIGVALDRQISEETLPIEPHDIPMDWVLTDTRCFGRGREPSASFTDLLAALMAERKIS